MKSAILCLIMMFLVACTKIEFVNCCPLSIGDIKNPKYVKDYLINNEIYKDYINKCKCIDK